MNDFEILIPGNYFCDIIFTGFPEFPSLGSEVYTQELTVTVGGVLNTVVALQRLGTNVGWIGMSGTDFFSRFVTETLEREGVDQSLIAKTDTPLQRVTVSLSYPNDRSFVSYVDPAPTAVQMLLDTLDAGHCSFRHLHFTGFETDPRTIEMIDRVHTLGAVVTMDCQDRPITIDMPRVRETLQRLAIFMPNAKEAMRFTGCASIGEAAGVLSASVPLVVIKDGANGAYAQQGEQIWHSPALAIVPVDTTGAGDVFNAGFLTAYREGRSIPECLRWGNVCGGLSTLGKGGITTAPRREEVERYL